MEWLPCPTKPMDPDKNGQTPKIEMAGRQNVWLEYVVKTSRPQHVGSLPTT